jgi:hypothetical protein
VSPKRKKKILFIIGSPNQTTQMHQIYLNMKDEFDCYFTQFFPADWIMHTTLKLGTLEHTIISGRFKEMGEKFVKDHGLQYDYAGETLGNKYDLIFLCTDMSYPKICKETKTIWVQEGMTDPVNSWAKFIKKMKMPSYMAFKTSLNGSSNKADIYCVASQGYKDYFNGMGTEQERIVVTGIPNYDNAREFLTNNFPYKDYVLVCTSDIREQKFSEDRIGFIKKCVEIANGQRLFFKLHPNEIYDRAYNEIIENTPKGTMVFQDEDTNHMIANCNELITQYSTVVYIGIALGKPVHSYFNIEVLKKQLPIQNEGTSAMQIAAIAREFVDFNGDGKQFLTQYVPETILQSA